MKRIFAAISALTLAVLACAAPGIVPTAPLSPATEVPTGAMPPTPVSVTDTSPAPSPASGLLPAGFVVFQENGKLIFYNADGVATTDIAIESDSGVNRFSLHVAGGVSAGLPPVDYFIWRGSDPIIAENTGGIETLLMYQPDFFRLAGAPGTPYFAYTTATYADTGQHTRLYIGTAGTIASAAPVLDLIDPNGYALKPLAFRMEGGSPTGLWYTGCLYGIGGDLAFDPCNRLSFLDLTTGASIDIFGDGYNPAGISPDGQWVAYAYNGGGQPLQVMNLATGVSYSFAPWVLNDRGSGEAVFSPDSMYVAWMEASGYRMDEPITFQTNLRIGTTYGVALAQYLDDSFDVAAGFPILSAMPVGWLDNDSVLVQVGGFDWTQSAILRLDLDGTITYLAPGFFITLAYP
jgi:hypothetical protein